MKAEVKMKVLVMNCSPVRNGATAEIVFILMINLCFAVLKSKEER